MKRLALLTAAAAAGLAAASPAAAQYPNPYPNPYPQQYQQQYQQQYPYGNNQGGNVLGQIINSVIGYGQYPYGNYGYGQPGYQSQQVAVSQCARAVEARLNGYAMNDNYNQWNPNQNPYSGWARQGSARVLGVDDVRVRKNNRIRVRGVATSGNAYAQQYGYGGYQYNRSYGTPDLRFTCNADLRGRVYDVDIERMNYYNNRRR